jgi:hypothetical protein
VSPTISSKSLAATLFAKLTFFPPISLCARRIFFATARAHCPAPLHSLINSLQPSIHDGISFEDHPAGVHLQPVTRDPRSRLGVAQKHLVVGRAECRFWASKTRG